MRSSEKTIIKDFKAVDFMRKTRDKISSEIADMTFEEIKDYFKKRREKPAKTYRK